MNKAENRVFLIKFVGLFFNIKDVLKALKKKKKICKTWYIYKYKIVNIK